MAPGWVSYLLRVFSWKLMLGTGGALNQILMGLGLLREPAPWLLYSMSAVVAVLVYVWIPFAALPIFVALEERVDRSLLEAAADLGARPWQAFRRVTLPLSLPGVSAAFCLVFIPTLGEYVTPLLVGGPRGQLFGNLVQSQFQKAMNWPLGSALSLMMLLGGRAGHAAAGAQRPPGSGRGLRMLGHCPPPVAPGRRVPLLPGLQSPALPAPGPPAALLLQCLAHDGFSHQGLDLGLVSPGLEEPRAQTSPDQQPGGGPGLQPGGHPSGQSGRGGRDALPLPGRRLLLAVAALPLVVPSIVLAVALLAGATQLNSLLATAALGGGAWQIRPFSLWTVGISHVVIALPMVILIVAARLVRHPAAPGRGGDLDLGCSYWGAQRRVTLPLARPAILAAFLTAFSSSFDEFGTAFLLAGTRQTLPTYLYSQLRSAYKLPMVVAAAAVIIVASLLLVAATELLRRGGEPRSGRP